MLSMNDWIFSTASCRALGEAAPRSGATITTNLSINFGTTSALVSYRKLFETLSATANNGTSASKVVYDDAAAGTGHRLLTNPRQTSNRNCAPVRSPDGNCSSNRSARSSQFMSRQLT